VRAVRFFPFLKRIQMTYLIMEQSMKTTTVIVRRIIAIVRHFLGVSLGVLLLATSAQAQQTNTAIKKIDRVQIYTGPNYGYAYHFLNLTGWGAPGCAGAPYAQVLATDQGAKELYATLLVAYTLQQNVVIFGQCLDVNFFKAEAIQTVP
jgi:hypothetical protein